MILLTNVGLFKPKKKKINKNQFDLKSRKIKNKKPKNKSRNMLIFKIYKNARS